MPALSRLATALLCACAAASAVQAQQVKPVPNKAPSSASQTARSAPKPTGLMPTFPAGISSGSGAAVSTDPVGRSTTPVPPAGNSVATTVLAPGRLAPAEVPSPDARPASDAAAATTVLGAGATVRGPGQTFGGAGGFSATDEARSFFFADANHDGELTRAEFGRLGIAPLSFEESDRNYDGVISRFEYEDSLR